MAKKFPATKNFLDALQANFYDKITKITALIFDEDQECRGYIAPVFIDRKFNRKLWDSYKINLELGSIGVKIFSSYKNQPESYKNFFDQMIENTKLSKFFFPDFCPDNIAFSLEENRIYLIDLEDVQPISKFNDQQIKKVFFDYNPNDYIETIKLIVNT